MFDPHATSHPVANAVFRHACEPLFYEDARRRIRGLLAEDEPAFDADGRRVVVRLRPGIVFHDGRRLDPAAVVASFARLQRLGVSPLANDLRNVSVEAGPEAGEVAFRLPRPDFELVRLVLANPYAVVVSPGAGAPAAPGFVACTGPYRFEPALYRPGESLGLVRFARYAWPRAEAANRGPAHIPQLWFEFEADREARVARLLQGEACVLSLSDEHVARARAAPGVRLYTAIGGVTYLGFNFQRSRWQDVRLRRAVAHAVDREALAAGGPFLVARGPLAPNAIGYDPAAEDAALGHDPARTAALLREAGFDPGAEVVLLVPESNTYAELAEAVLADLAAAGIRNVRVRAAPRAAILEERQDFDLLVFDYAWGDYSALAIFIGPGPRNLLGYAEGDVARLVAEARATAKEPDRRPIILRAQKTVLERALWQPLVVRRLTLAVDGRCVHGETQSPDGELQFHDARTDGGTPSN